MRHDVLVFEVESHILFIDALTPCLFLPFHLLGRLFGHLLLLISILLIVRITII